MVLLSKGGGDQGKCERLACLCLDHSRHLYWRLPCAMLLHNEVHWYCCIPFAHVLLQ
jgi:hypothetical protein